MSQSPAPPSQCPQCGDVLAEGAPEGLCPKCLMAQAMQPTLLNTADFSPATAADFDSSAATLPVSGPRPSLAGKAIDLPLPEELTKLLPAGSYEVTHFLGAGGMGAVYKGQQVRLKRPVAIKIMRRDMGKDYDFEQRFEREAQAMAKLNHPNIVSVIDYGEAGPDYLYIVMELIDGADMMDVIRGGQMTQEMALSLLPQICDALQFAHDHGIVHRDIKPSNIMLTRDGRIKMADFGLAKRFDAEDNFRTQTGTGMGTPDYAAPEQFDPKANIDHRADIYALGVMIYQMITGQLPRGAWKPPSQRAEVAPQWDGIVSRAMQSDPSERYQQATEVKTDVSSIALSSGKPAAAAAAVPPSEVAPPPATAPAPAPTAKSRTPLLIGSIVGALVLIFAGIFALQKPETAQAQSQSPVPPYINREGTEDWRELPAGVWIPLKFKPELNESQLYHATASGDLKLVHSTYLTGISPTDIAIRMHVKASPQAKETFVRLRTQMIGARGLVFTPKTSFLLNRFAVDQTQSTGVPHPPELGITSPVLLEAAAIGDTTYGAVNGSVLPPLVMKDELLSPGQMYVTSPDSEITGIEFMILDGVSADKYPDFVKQSRVQVATSTPDLSKIEPGKWVPLKGLLKPSDVASTGATLSTEGVLKVGGFPLILPGINARDVALRARVKRAENTSSFLIARRKFKASRTLQFFPDTTAIQATYEGQRGGTNPIPHDPQLGVASAVMLEMAVIDDAMYATVNGVQIGPHRKPLPSEAGEVALSGVGSEFSDIEVMLLDGVSADKYPDFVKASKKAGVPAPVAEEPWLDYLHDPAKIQLTPGLAVAAEGLRFTGAGAVKLLIRKTLRDGAVRMRATFGGLRPQLIARESTEGVYQLLVRDAGMVELNRWDTKAARTIALGKFPLPTPLKEGADYELELRFVGDTLTAKLNGHELGVVKDATNPDGTMGVRVLEQQGAPCLVKSIDMLDLDPRSKSTKATPPPAAAAAATPNTPPGKWVKLYTKWEDLPADMRKADSGVKFENGWFKQSLSGKGIDLRPPLTSSHSIGIRATFRSTASDQATFLFVTQNDGLNYHAGVTTGGTFIKRSERGKQTTEPGLDKTLRITKPVGEEYTLEFIIVGKRLIARTNGKALTGLAPEQLDQVSTMIHFGHDVRDIEVLNLEGLSEAEALKIAGVDAEGKDLRGKASTSASSTQQNGWIDLLSAIDPVQDAWKTGGQVGANQWQKKGSTLAYLADGKIGKITAPGLLAAGTCEMQLSFVRDTDDVNVRLDLTGSSSAGGKTGGFALEYLPKEVRAMGAALFQSDTAFGAGGTPITTTLSYQERGGFRTLTVSVNGQEPVTIPIGKAEPLPGTPALSIMAGPAGAVFQEWRLKPGTAKWDAQRELAFKGPSMTAEPATKPAADAATNAAPFTNTLGMKFVPVPGTDVQFCIHEVRYKDYAAFAAETPSIAQNWMGQSKDGFTPTERTAEHPVTKVNWDEAQAFCDWLSKKEGKLYRLPTDKEWSAAVGLGQMETRPPGIMPATLSGKENTEFPWGGDFPPSTQDQAGNYSDASRKAKAPGTDANEEYIENHDDGFPTTSPVMSFKPNKLGLYDLGGNVQEWCVDWYDTAQKDRVLRGASYRSGDRFSLLSSHRGHAIPDRRNFDFGFRLVLETRSQTVVVSTPGPAPAPAPASKDAPFINSLGMKFVPVPGFPMFCIHETRRQDYAAYAAAVPGVDEHWRTPVKDGVTISGGDDHPVCSVSWHEAQAFCNWLSTKEGLKYRLPTDREWSAAVGVQPEEDYSATSTPGLRNGKLANKYPWGIQWPPPQGAGNFADTSFLTQFPGQPIIDGYTDGHAGTAPIMSFKPNAFGIYDLSGNVWEWCSDRWDTTTEDRVLRGGSWETSLPGHLNSSARSHNPPEWRVFTGFRCVLELNAPAKAP